MIPTIFEINVQFGYLPAQENSEPATLKLSGTGQLFERPKTDLMLYEHANDGRRYFVREVGSQMIGTVQHLIVRLSTICVQNEKDWPGVKNALREICNAQPKEWNGNPTESLPLALKLRA